jgi:hypothetical protein
MSISACNLIYTSRFVEAEEAYRIDLLDRLVPADTLLEEAMALARSIASWPPVAMQAARSALQQSMESTLEEQLRHESFGLLVARRAPHDVQEARDSFLERRPPILRVNSMVQWLMVVWCLMSIWGCANAVVQPDPQEQSAIAFAQKVLKEMSQGLEKLRVSLDTTIQEKGTYRIFTAHFFPRNVTIANMMQNFTHFCTQIDGTMVQSVCQASTEEMHQVKFLVRVENLSPKSKTFMRMYVTVYEPVGAPSEEFLRVIWPYR